MKHTLRLFKAGLVGTTLVSVLVGCGAAQDPATSGSDVKVTNGREVAESDFPSVVLLYMPDITSICTGTFVNNAQVVTAGHCVEGLDSENPNMVIVREVDGKLTAVAKAIRYQRNPNYNIDLGVNPNDLSVVTFPANTAPATTRVTTVTPRAGDAFTIVGFGNNENFINESGELDGSGAGVKRAGSNRVSSVSGGFISFTGVPGAGQARAGQQVSSGAGDSGGPLFINGRLAGVTSGGGLRQTSSGPVAQSFYVDLTSSASRAFLSRAPNTR